MENLRRVLALTAPWWGLTLISFLLCYLLTPLCRGLARRLGMVDQPSARRINTTPTPRGGGLAIYLATSLTLIAYVHFTGMQISPLFSNAVSMRMIVLGSALVGVGLLDDKFGLPPLVKLFGQIAVALGVFFWCGCGLHVVPLLKDLPMWLDCGLTVFWIVGAVNAFNLIDGLDGLATGLALIAAVGMGGALFFIGYPEATLVYFVFAGACLAFLRYNFHPASVFLGDTGSMFLGFTLATLPLFTKSSDSLLVSLGVPLLAMGVPIFDTSLAIIRRTLRAVLTHEEHGANEGNTHVMRADTDHLHHRLLRRFVSQRKAACALYGMAVFFVCVGLAGLALRDRAAGLFIVAFVVGVIIILRDMRRIELWDAGRLLNTLAHSADHANRRRRRLLAIPYYVAVDVTVLVLVCVFDGMVLGRRINLAFLHTCVPLFVAPIFLALVFFRVYSTIWSRALVSNYIRLVLGCFIGTAGGCAGVVLFQMPRTHLTAFAILTFALTSMGLVAVRLVRPVVRDLFYALDHGRMAESPATRRIVVYGAGLRYAMFRRELVRSATRNTRLIVGLLDDDVLLRGLYIGGQRVHGTLLQAPEVLRALHADAVVIACQPTPERLALAKKIFAEAGVAVTFWTYEEKPV